MRHSGYASYDLHLHTYWSYDALAPVERYFRRARELQLRRIAITDHHTMDSMAEILEVAGQYPDVAFIPAAELSVTASIGSVDMVCLGLPLKTTDELEGVFAAYHEWQRAYGSAISDGMVALGYDYGRERRMELLQSYRPQRIIDVQGPTHVANRIQRAYFVSRKFAADMDEALALAARAAEEAPPPPYPKAEDVLPAVRRSGAVSVIAHPLGYFNGADRARMNALREELQFDGIECAHPATPAELTPIYRAYCKEHGLVSTAGSDCHNVPDENSENTLDVAMHRGEDVWLDELLDRIETTG